VIMIYSHFVWTKKRGADQGTFSLLAPEQLRQTASVAAASAAGLEVGARADK
jgi:hypothetical protein